jgi:hypothetical protein
VRKSLPGVYEYSPEWHIRIIELRESQVHTTSEIQFEASRALFMTTDQFTHALMNATDMKLSSDPFSGHYKSLLNASFELKNLG